MKVWIIFALAVMASYMIWTIAWEYGINKHRKCLCMTFHALIAAGILAVLALYLHVTSDCPFNKTVAQSFTSTPMFIYGIILTIATLMVVSNYYASRAVILGGNAGTVFAIANTYVVPVTLVSAYFYKTGLSVPKIIGTGAVLIGTYLMSK